MKASQPATNTFDDPSTRWAAERTLLAWVRTSLALIGLGFVVARFVMASESVGGGLFHPVKTFAEAASAVLGVAFVFLGAAATAAAALRYRRYLIDTAPLGKMSQGSALSFPTAVIVSVLGVLLAASLVVVSV